MSLYASGGDRIDLGPELGRGGEGAVFEVSGRPEVVAKVYHEPTSSEKGQKLERMSESGAGSLSSVSAWPISTLRARIDGPVLGIVMPRVGSRSEAHMLYNPQSRRQEFRRADYRFLVHVAANVARAVAVVHSHGHVVGDINHSGVLVAPDGTVRLIDCDSFQVSFGGRTFRCDVGVPEYTPPELQGAQLSQTDRTVNHDAFGLAVLIFQLLFMGRHPFSGTYEGKEQLPIGQAIREGRFAYGPGAATRGMRLPKTAIALDTVSSPVAHLFASAFLGAPKDRPSAAQWSSSLGGLLQSLRTCSSHPEHVYWTGRAACPWCEVRAVSGFDFFEGAPKASAVGEGLFDLARVWRRVERVSAPLEIPQTGSAPPPSPETRELQRLLRNGRDKARRTEKVVQVLALPLGLLLAGAAGLLFFGAGSLWAAPLAIAAAWAMFEGPSWSMPLPQLVRRARKKEKRRIQAATADRDRVAKRLRAVPDTLAQKKSELATLKQRLLRIDALERKEIDDLTRAQLDAQRDRFLARHPVSHAAIHGVGPAKKRALASHGIRTAKDVSQRGVQRVPGFGDALTGRVLSWRRSLVRSFAPDPSLRPDPRRVQAIQSKHRQDRARIQTQLVKGVASLEAARDELVAKREAHTIAMAAALHALSQAESNLRALSTRTR